MPDQTAPRCRDCGMYDYVHHRLNANFGVTRDHTYKRASTLRLWFMDHGTIWQHVKAWVWLNVLTGAQRFAYIHRLYKRHPDICWCALVDSWLYAEPGWRSDYVKPNGFICDFPLPKASMCPPPKSGCYCTPPEGGWGG